MYFYKSASFRWVVAIRVDVVFCFSDQFDCGDWILYVVSCHDHHYSGITDPFTT
jgi:hypothetical protein